MDETKYRAMIGSLLYLTASRHDIMFSVCLCSRFQKGSREVHLIAVKHISRHLIRTSNLGLLFKRRESFRLTSYCNENYNGDKIERKGTSGSFHLIRCNLVTWICKKQGSSALSTIEAKYMSTTSCCTQLLWILKTIASMRVKFLSIVIIEIL